MGTSASIRSSAGKRIANGTKPFMADGVQLTVTINHQAGFIPTSFSLVSDRPITLSQLARTVSFPDVNTMLIEFAAAPLEGEDANYSWTLFE